MWKCGFSPLHRHIEPLYVANGRPGHWRHFRESVTLGTADAEEWPRERGTPPLARSPRFSNLTFPMEPLHPITGTVQSRPDPEKDGLRIWLSRSEAAAFLEATDDEPRRRIALQLGLHGLHTHELLQVQPHHVRVLENGAEGNVLIVPKGRLGSVSGLLSLYHTWGRSLSSSAQSVLIGQPARFATTLYERRVSDERRIRAVRITPLEQLRNRAVEIWHELSYLCTVS